MIGHPFTWYYNYLMSILEQKPRLVPEVAGCSSKILTAQKHLEEENFAEAQKFLEEIVVIFKKHEQIDQELECELLLAECKANTGNLKQFR